MSIKPIKPGLGQESVWDYPRPPKLEVTNKPIKIIFEGATLVETTQAKRVLETSHPPVYYIPQADIEMRYLRPIEGSSWCEWKGRASYYALVGKEREILKAAWAYFEPTPAFAAIKDHLAFYAHYVDACYVDGERVQPQEGDFYGGWITANIVGPFKGGIGTRGW